MRSHKFIQYLFIGCLVAFVSCKKDEEKEIPDSLVGKYQIASVQLANAFMLADTIAIPQGQDLTVMMQNVLFGVADCANPSNMRIQLQETKQIFLLCEGENKSTQNGTWNVNVQRTELSLNVNISFDQGTTTIPFQLVLSNLNEATNSVSGVIMGVPLPPLFFMAFGINLSGTGQPFYPINLSMALTKVN